MRRLALVLILVPLTGAAAKGRGSDFDACDKGQVEVGRSAAAFHGETMIKRLIEADIARARKEVNEGDADECLEALDHARKLLAGQY